VIVRERVGGGPRFHVVVAGDRVRTFRRRCDAARYERRRDVVEAVVMESRRRDA